MKKRKQRKHIPNYHPEFPNMAQIDEEFGALLDVLWRIQPKALLEIGIWQGGTLSRFAHAFPSSIVVGVDIHAREQLNGKARRRHETYWNFRGARLYEGSSHDDEFMRGVAEDSGPFDFVFIDGDHSYAGAKQDWELALRLDPILIAMHDVNCRDIECSQLWREIVHSGEYETETIGADKQYGIGLAWL